MTALRRGGNPGWLQSWRARGDENYSPAIRQLLFHSFVLFALETYLENMGSILEQGVRGGVEMGIQVAPSWVSSTVWIQNTARGATCYLGNATVLMQISANE